MEPLTCALCDSEDAVLCTLCKDTAFCARGCNVTGERIHKLLCPEIERWGQSTARPTEDSYIGILFPENGTSPEFYWSQGRYKLHTNEITGLVERIDLLSVNGKEVTSGDIEIACNLATKNEIPIPFIFSMRDRRVSDGSSVNLSILEMTRGDQRGVWAGPAVIYCRNEHVCLADLTFFTTFLEFYRDKAGSLKHAIRVGELSHVESGRPQLFNEVRQFAQVRKQARKVLAAPVSVKRVRFDLTNIEDG
ncbi:uncharacterized protein RSE6_14850 [Rhynchosporium secalis]|uniref:MYND-type domain-containing protein n=1 Tax=Rhynchosporium secalis TaxID=38038 RepID=A0A1E1MW99_RHYSE|nr:uncharacterized protein RSE6_14850 [Rhynchosporium secalis]